ncbi:MAG TPA: aminomethyl-transferring glycine dehydrogenase subunit GcvPB [Polyangiaceae bacterium]|jgi:glycine dehydrogenase subunit 2|nr:MAG: putative glycine dehydrogenase (decarboxylating) subunit 2 [Deltaproteobacteria bacterium ADurb.Bin207]HNS95725.1 aminomethyl-transferring glycine dehydrogenase subunit GcvPB [Polyangiaceae bacterium]HNZ21192.1 aminomethyl-transferring glycine dehydrogenase subunit GcvPB [Polyangiaceae bacterium]HOD25367.1 aminomethyl-transferring glycine dehydrogenase subunit GcvPB [Polyangiaceae bacterium]HOE48062.1 aminomethyl-transferring glycine dehydrogenase subunit GcvPB [Polyangiaceae bacterium]
MAMEAVHGLQFEEAPIFERGSVGRCGASLSVLDVPEVDLGGEYGELVRKVPAGLPEVSEPEVFRHFVRLSQHNFSVDTQFYPLGSCTMKHNPKVNEWAARLVGFSGLHPATPADFAQGALSLIWHLERALAEICGMDDVSLQPAAGAQGEVTGLMMIRAYHQAKGRAPRTVLVPDTAHGTNPASCALNGLQVKPFPSGDDGIIDPAKLSGVVDQVGDDLAAVMITNPNTLGLFESALPTIDNMVHERGGMLYGDGANLNALMGRARPGDLGFDVVQLNLHKTFSTPHGGGGPGAGPIAFKASLIPFQPRPVVCRKDDRFRLEVDRPHSIGRVRSYFGNFGVMVRAYTYIRELGAEGLKQATDMAVLNANYLAALLKDTFPLAQEKTSMHEAVFSDRVLEAETGIKTLDIAKRLIDYGFHPPTVYFPLVVKGAMMIEPTETESKETIEAFVSAMKSIEREARESPELVREAPHLTRLDRLDEARAARKPRLRWSQEP